MTRFHTTRYIHTHPRTSHIHNFILVALEFHTRTLVHTVNTSHLPSATSYLLEFIHVPSQVHTNTPLLTTECVYHTQA